MLCDRVAVLVGGKLQGVGAPAEIVSVEVQSMEILFELPPDRALPQSLAGNAKSIGGRYRVAVPEAEVYATLDQLRVAQARILSMSPVRPTLEDYFIRLVGRERAATHELEVVRR
jgi:ABC-type multidrug transport system ATPase subunit